MPTAISELYDIMYIPDEGDRIAAFREWNREWTDTLNVTTAVSLQMMIACADPKRFRDYAHYNAVRKMSEVLMKEPGIAKVTVTGPMVADLTHDSENWTYSIHVLRTKPRSQS